MSKVRDDSGTPRAIIHKRILDVAESDPEASLAEIAGEVSGATPDLVERVLTKYGDPCETDTDEASMSQNGQSVPTTQTEQSTDDQTPTESTSESNQTTGETENGDGNDFLSLTGKQRETLRAVHENPTASQGEIAERLDVSRATVSRRLSDISGFEWQERRAFTTEVFGERDEATTTETDPSDPVRDDVAERLSGLDDIEERMETLEAQINDLDTRAQTEEIEAIHDRLATLDERLSVLDEIDERVETLEETERPTPKGASADLPPELAHKVVHAVMESDRVTEDEELQLLETLLE